MEATCEIRFASTSQKVGPLLPGLLQPKLRELFPAFDQLPAANLPVELRHSEASLKHVHLYRLSGEVGYVNFGDNVVTVSVSGTKSTLGKDYPGWESFRALAVRVFEAALATDGFGSAERISVKYINLLGGPTPLSVSELTKASIKLGDMAIEMQPLNLRTELRNGDMVTIVDIGTPATLTLLDGSTLQGLVLAIDTVHEGPFSDIRQQLPALLDEVHAEEKRVFYSVLSEKSLLEGEPEYD